MELSHSWKFLENPAVAQLLKNIPIFYGTRRCVHKSPPLVFILGRINPVHATPPCFRSILISSYVRLGLPGGLVPLAITKVVYSFLLSLLRATCPAYVILFDLISLINKLLSSSQCSFPLHPVIASFFGPNILSTLFSDIPNCVLYIMSETMSDTHKNYTQN